MDVQLDFAPCGYFSITNTGIVRSMNRTLLNLLECERETLTGQHIESILPVTSKLFFHTYFYPHIQLHGQVDEMYCSLRTSGGQNVPVLLNGVRQERDGELCIDCVVVKIGKRIEHEKDVLQTTIRLEELYRATQEANESLERLHAEYVTKQQELMRLNEQLEALASTDPLTGLRNRRFFQERLLASVESYRHKRRLFSLLIVDIDYFKSINDTYGHPAGDAVLVRLAQLLKSMAREDDVVARIGGEEFVVIAPNTDYDDIMRLAESCRARIEATPMDGHRITVSIGAATIGPEDTDAGLLHEADQALYLSKSGGRNRVTHAAALSDCPPALTAAIRQSAAPSE